MPSRSFRNHNPGNIRHHDSHGKIYPVVARWGGLDDGDNYADFKSVPDGCAALADLIAMAYETSTVAAMIAHYAPCTDQNDPEKYTRQVCTWAGIKPETTVRDLPPDKFFALCAAVCRFEGWP